jgi:imidazolonepropionase-like amidohydrolase
MTFCANVHVRSTPAFDRTAGGALRSPAAAEGECWVSSASHERKAVLAATETAYGLAKKYRLKTAFGTDILFSPALAQRQGTLLARLARWYTPAEALVMATGTNAQLLAMCGKRNPYPGKLGVVEEGALADLILVEGNPIEDIKLVADPGKNFVLIMKDGKIYKNTLGMR